MHILWASAKIMKVIVFGMYSYNKMDITGYYSGKHLYMYGIKLFSFTDYVL